MLLFGMDMSVLAPKTPHGKERCGEADSEKETAGKRKEGEKSRKEPQSRAVI